MRLIFTFCLLVVVSSVSAQDKGKLFGTGAPPEAKKGFIINGNVGYDLPGGDMAKRFGSSYRLGPALFYKTASNWIIGVKCDFILGNIIKQDSLMINIRDKYSAPSTHLYEFINKNGDRVGVPVYERGYAIGIEGGKIISTNKFRPDNGIELLGTVGFMQHRIDIFNEDKSVWQIQGSYLKGYDRLTNGLFAEAYAGYIYFARNRLLNFNIGLDALFGFTKGRRDYLYDVMRPDNKNRLDMLFGIRGGWFIPIFKRKSEELLFQ